MKKVLFISGFLVLGLFFSCKKNQLGGKSLIKGTVKHHEKIIPFARVFLKFKAKEFPGADTTKYDSTFRTDATGTFSFTCYKGDYYLYGYGEDKSIGKNVVGGIPVHIRNKETVETDVLVSED